MIIQRMHPLMRQRRSAFTLLEVLVVVAIILVLASVATVAVFQIMEDTKPNMAKANCQTLSTALKTYMLNNNNNPPSDITEILRYIEGRDPSKLIDPWNNQYQMGEDENGYYIFTTAPDGTIIRSDAKFK
jgi:general secretion pathway protein G